MKRYVPRCLEDIKVIARHTSLQRARCTWRHFLQCCSSSLSVPFFASSLFPSSQQQVWMAYRLSGKDGSPSNVTNILLSLPPPPPPASSSHRLPIQEFLSEENCLTPTSPLPPNPEMYTTFQKLSNGNWMWWNWMWICTFQYSTSGMCLQRG